MITLPMESSSKTTIIAVLILVYMAVSTYAAVYYYRMYTTYEAKVPKEQKQADKDIDMTLALVKKLMSVPDERPTMAVVKDAETLKEQQQFFAQAQNGDKLLIFRNAKKVILYRASINKIIESGPLLVTPDNATGQQVQPVKVAIYNGTTNKDLLAMTDEKLRKASNAVIETTLSTAKKTDYTKTLVVDVTGKNKASVDELAKFLGGEVGALPAEETKPDSEILIIVGEQNAK